MVLQEGQHQAYGCSGSVHGWGGVAAVVSAASVAAADAGEEVGENRPNKKPKQKKTPQRGLGVAQLEKIRLEEQQNGAVVTPASSLAGSFSPVIPFPPLPLPSTPFSGASDLNAVTRPPSIPIPPAAFCDLLVPMPPPVADGSMVAPPARLAGHGFLPPLLWNPLEISPRDVEASNKTFGFPFPLQDDTLKTNTWQTSGSVERHHQHRQQQPKHPLPNSPVNPSLSLPLSGVKLRMEPPSNQTSMSKPGSPLWPADEKMAGMKRPWPFHLDAIADYTSFPCKLPLPPLPFPRADEHPTVNGRDLLDFKPAITNLRDGLPSSGAFGLFQVEGRSSYGHPPEKMCKQRSSAPVHGDFLSLGSSLSPPAPPAAPPKLTQTAGNTLLPYYREPSAVLAPIPYHGNPDETNLRFGGSPQSPDRLPFYSFLPLRSSSQETSLEEHRRETVGSIDLNLKL